MDDVDTFTPGRTVDIDLGTAEVITIDLDNLDPNPDDVLDLLKDGQCKDWVWTKLAGEYWRKGYLDGAERIAFTASESFQSNGSIASLPPIHCLLANIMIARSRVAPKHILADARQDLMTEERPKEDYYREAAQLLNAAERVARETGEGVNETLAFLTRGIQQLATRSMDDALRSFEGVLAVKPTNLNPSGWAAQLLLGLEAINTSKNTHLPEADRTQAFISGTKLVETAFRANQKSAAAANALCEIFLRKGNLKRALKLAERTIQFADTLTILTEGHLRAGRVCHAESSHVQAERFYSAATDGQPKHVLGAIGLAQMQLQNDEVPAAIHTLDTLLQPPNPQKSLEATVMLASLRAHPRPGVSSADMAQEKIRARDLFERVGKSIELDEVRTNGQPPSRASRAILDDMDMHAEIARLWQGENIDRMGKALKEALRISESTGKVDPRLLNNLGVLQHLEGSLPSARNMYETALTTAAGLSMDISEAMSTSILYNLARVYEDQGEEGLAKEAYEKLLSRHPEYVDAKIRQAQMLSNINRHNDAHELIKQCLTSQNSNLNIRAFYTYFLIQTNSIKIAKDFVFSTLKDFDKYDTYSLCAAGWIQYHQSRESRDNSQDGVKERKRGFQRSAEFYEKALQLDPQCAFAAQGLAIVTAEDALGTLGGALPGSAPADEGLKRVKNAREALDIFAKVRESKDDGSVYFNMGHCHYACDEFDRAIESYETASKFYDNHNISVLSCLCRSWYSKATKDQSYAAMNTALKYAQKALHNQPGDKAIMYNIAMIQQKSAEMLFALPPNKRSLADLQRVIEQASHAQKIFASLANVKAQLVPYSKDIADNRRKYGESMLRKAEDHLAAQRQHDADTQSRLEAARRKRQEERERQEAIERELAEKLRIEAEKLAEERRLAREQAIEWTREVRMDSDEEKEKKPKKTRKPRSEAPSGDEGEPRKKRRGKLRKASPEAGDEEGGAIFTDDEEVERPAKKRTTKKRVVRDDDEEEVANPRKKQFKSKEMLSDTDEEMS
ncbi:hypothetical protein NP233_g216 [Leucocoprinus birnbaumii]|uniref:TPR-like protein n=1 Tax=Leucocoprinus birnbaumii TaxID=56174 RepID=A0AAD5W2A8_9AGAR|nr:hypothetical protein NP233_g216 [Leucocoprinus birnbaumii]